MFKHFCKISISATCNQKPHNWFSYIKSFILGLAHSKFSKVWATVIFFFKLILYYSPGSFTQTSRDEYYWLITRYQLITYNQIPCPCDGKPQNCTKDAKMSAHKHSWGDRTRWAGGGGWEKKKAHYHNPTEGIKVCKTVKHTFASLHDLSDSTVKA